jgi:hypothetical protein
MRKSQQYVIYGIIALPGILFSLGAYASIWEALQPEQHLSNMKISSIEQYCSSNDLNWSLRGYRVYTIGEHKPIYFPLKNWDSTVQIGDTVNLAVRRSFPWLSSKDELDGLSITDHKSKIIKATRHVKTQESLFDE